MQDFFKIAMRKLGEESFKVIILVVAVIYLNQQNINLVKENSKTAAAIMLTNSTRIDNLTKQVDECAAKYQDLLKMYYFSHDELTYKNKR